MGQAIGRGIDNASENKNHNSEKIGSLVDFALGIPSGSVSNSLKTVSYTATGISAIGTTETEINLSKNAKNDSNNDGKTASETKSSSSKTKDGKEKNYVFVNQNKTIQPENPFFNKKEDTKKTNNWWNQ